MKLKKTVVDIIRANPGLDGHALKGKGWRPSSHGSIREAEKAGLIRWDMSKGGWVVVDNPKTSS